MPVNMLRPDERFPASEAIFTEFGIAMSRCQEVEALLALNLQYSLALVGGFGTLDDVDASARKHSVVSMGQLFEKLSPYLNDLPLAASIEHAVSTRNYLAHKFFFNVQSGALATQTEIDDAIRSCRAASEEFVLLIDRLERAWASVSTRLNASPDSFVPGMQARISAIERGDYPIV